MTAPLARVGVVSREPIPVRVIRYGCPSCGRRASSRSRAGEHMARCWWDPANRACKTCAHFRPEEDACGCVPSCNWGNSGQSVHEHCAKGVDLSGRPACVRCGGFGSVLVSGAASECGDCGGEGAEVKPGPIVHCAEWAMRPEAERG
jgi:hypothetical protein